MQPKATPKQATQINTQSTIKSNNYGTIKFNFKFSGYRLLWPVDNSFHRFETSQSNQLAVVGCIGASVGQCRNYNYSPYNNDCASHLYLEEMTPNLKICKELRYEWVAVGQSAYIKRCVHQRCRHWQQCPHAGAKHLTPTHYNYDFQKINY